MRTLEGISAGNSFCVATTKVPGENADPRFARTPLKCSGAIGVTSTSRSAAVFSAVWVLSGIGFAVAIVLRENPQEIKLVCRQEFFSAEF
jgi:hypothetical protein